MRELFNNFWGLMILDGLFFTFYFMLISFIYKWMPERGDAS